MKLATLLRYITFVLFLSLAQSPKFDQFIFANVAIAQSDPGEEEGDPGDIEDPGDDEEGGECEYYFTSSKLGLTNVKGKFGAKCEDEDIPLEDQDLTACWSYDKDELNPDAFMNGELDCEDSVVTDEEGKYKVSSVTKKKKTYFVAVFTEIEDDDENIVALMADNPVRFPIAKKKKKR